MRLAKLVSYIAPMISTSKPAFARAVASLTTLGLLMIWIPETMTIFFIYFISRKDRRDRGKIKKACALAKSLRRKGYTLRVLWFSLLS